MCRVGVRLSLIVVLYRDDDDDVAPPPPLCLSLPRMECSMVNNMANMVKSLFISVFVITMCCTWHHVTIHHGTPVEEKPPKIDEKKLCRDVLLLLMCVVDMFVCLCAHQ